MTTEAGVDDVDGGTGVLSEGGSGNPPPPVYESFAEARVDLWAKTIEGPTTTGALGGFCGNTRAVWIEISTDGSERTFRAWNSVSGDVVPLEPSKRVFSAWHASDRFVAYDTVRDQSHVDVVIQALDGAQEVLATIPDVGTPSTIYATDDAVYVVGATAPGAQESVLRGGAHRPRRSKTSDRCPAER